MWDLIVLVSDHCPSFYFLFIDIACGCPESKLFEINLIEVQVPRYKTVFMVNSLSMNYFLRITVKMPLTLAF